MKPLTIKQIRKLHKFLIYMCIVIFICGILDIYVWYIVYYMVPSYVLGTFFIAFSLSMGLAQYVAFKITDLLMQSEREIKEFNVKSLS